MGPKPTYRRTQFIVDRSYQMRFVMNLLSMLVGVMFLSFIAASALVWMQLSTPDGTTGSCLPLSLLAVASVLSIQVLLFVPIIYYYGIRETHRVVGPVQRIKHTLEAIGSGDFSQRVVLRKGDVLTELTDAINQMAERLNKRFPKP